MVENPGPAHRAGHTVGAQQWVVEWLNDGAGGWPKEKQNQGTSVSEVGLAKSNSPPSDPQTFRFPQVCLGKGLTWAWVYNRCPLNVRWMSPGILPILGVGEGGVRRCFLLCAGALPSSLWPVSQRTPG